MSKVCACIAAFQHIWFWWKNGSRYSICQNHTTNYTRKKMSDPGGYFVIGVASWDNFVSKNTFLSRGEKLIF